MLPGNSSPGPLAPPSGSSILLRKIFSYLQLKTVFLADLLPVVWKVPGPLLIFISFSFSQGLYPFSSRCPCRTTLLFKNL